MNKFGSVKHVWLMVWYL